MSKLNSNALKTGLIEKMFSPAPFIGLDLGMEKLNMVQVGFKSGIPVIIAASSDYHNLSYDELIKQPEKFKALIKQAFKSSNFKGRKVVASLPTPPLKILFLNFQCKPHEDEAQAMLSALKHRVDENLSEYVIDYLPVNPQATEQFNRVALVAMAKHDAIDDFLNLLDYCGLTIEALEIGPVAINRLVSAITTAEQLQKVLVVNFGAEKSYLTVIWNNELLLDREIDFGLESVLVVIAKTFDINTQTALKVLYKYGLIEDETQVTSLPQSDDDDENDDSSIKNVLADILRPVFFHLTEEIKDVLVYVASETRGGAVEQIFLMGSLARIAAVDQIIDRLISIPVQTINPFFGFEQQDSTHFLSDLGPLSGVAVATGLSMRGKI